MLHFTVAAIKFLLPPLLLHVKRTLHGSDRPSVDETKSVFRSSPFRRLVEVRLDRRFQECTCQCDKRRRLSLATFLELRHSRDKIKELNGGFSIVIGGDSRKRRL
ncbi:hypothetical protein L596_013934 [Steinernema carpocapsae]|uniref:Secreted protein n=1 Tax=Steinernema carpocapsae TaxID=34508 RepID=A0A4V6A580_STECR|nr:hypothetical protein L596_013934 [Steinernema carpocapsae]